MATIALVPSSFWPRVGGVEEHVRHMATALTARGHRVAVWAADRGDDTAGVENVVPGVRVRYLPAPLPHRSPGGVARFAVSAPPAWRAWTRAAAADRPDLLHVHCFGPNGTWATAVARRRHVPLVVGTHGETSADASGVFDVSALQRRALRSSLRHAAAVTTCSAWAAADLERFGLAPGAATWVGNGVDLDEPVGTRPFWLPERYVLAVGRIDPVKGFDLLVRAFARARADGSLDPGTQLVCAGDGPARAEVDRLARSLGLGGQVLWPGFLDRVTVGAVVAGAEVLVVPSRVEAFGIVALEGMRAGVPVVASDRGGTGEFVRHDVDGLLVDPQDTERLAAAIVRACEPDVRDRLVAAGRTTVLAHSWHAVADRTVAVYDEVLRTRTAKVPR